MQIPQQVSEAAFRCLESYYQTPMYMGYELNRTDAVRELGRKLTLGEVELVFKDLAKNGRAEYRDAGTSPMCWGEYRLAVQKQVQKNFEPFASAVLHEAAE
jgi:hypothetical protein